MPVSLVQTSQTLAGGAGVALGLNAAFQHTYNTRLDFWKPLLAPIMDEVPSTMELETYFYRESRPYPSRWPAGSTRGTKGFKTVRWSVFNKDWTDGVGWNRNHLSDDVTRSLEKDVRETASRWSTLRMRIASQIIQGATDFDLLDSIPNAPDGVDLYNATDGAGAARFGVTGGNLLTGTGVANESQIIKDFYLAQARFLAFLDTESQPLIDPATFAEGFTIMYPPALTEVMKRAFKNAAHIVTSAATGAMAGTASIVAVAATPNTARESGDNVTLFPNPYLTDAADYYIFLNGANVKPIFWQDRQGVQERILTMETGDRHAIETKEESIFWDSRGTGGVNLPYGTVAIV
jgi:phage major head subunit gpT-like protein